MQCHWRSSVVLLAFALMIGACGGVTAPSQPGGSTLPPSAASRAPGPAGFAPSRTGPVADKLAKALLTSYDVPASWKRSKDVRGDPEDTTICDTSLATLEQHRAKLAEVDVGFERGSAGPFVVQAAAAYPAGTAPRVMDSLAAAVQPCRTLTVRDEEGTLTQWELTPIPFPQLGDQTVAFREYQPVNAVAALVVYVRRGDLVTVVITIAIRAPVDRAQAERFARRADEKLAAVAAGR